MQRIAVELTPRGLRVDEIIHLISATLEPKLDHYNLNILIDPVFKTSDFWATVEEYKGRIEWIQFDIVSPNLNDISKSMNESLIALAKETGSHTTVLKPEAKQGDVLNVQRGSMIEGLVELASKGNGPITIKAKGIKHKISVARRTKTVKIKELTLEGSGADIIGAFKDLMHDADA